MPTLLFCRSALALGVVVGVMFLPLALSTSVVVSHRLALAPDHLRGRVQASAAFLAGSISWLGPLAAGVLFQEAGETAAVLALTGWTCGRDGGDDVTRAAESPRWPRSSDRRPGSRLESAWRMMR